MIKKRQERTGLGRRLVSGASALKGMLVAVSWLPVIALAQANGLDGGLGKVTSYVDTIVVILQTILVGVGTIALIILGYKFFFGQARGTDLIPPLIGALLAGSATAIIEFLVG